VFVVGDSLTVGAKPAIEAGFADPERVKFSLRK
jgi:hypothetical protein